MDLSTTPASTSLMIAGFSALVVYTIQTIITAISGGIANGKKKTNIRSALIAEITILRDRANNMIGNIQAELNPDKIEERIAGDKLYSPYVVTPKHEWFVYDIYKDEIAYLSRKAIGDVLKFYSALQLSSL